MKQICSLVLIFAGLGLSANAAPVDSTKMAEMLTVGNTAQAAEKDLVEKGLYKEALAQWDKSYAITPFADGPSGQAFFALLLLRNNISVVGFDRLTAINDPESMSPGLKNILAQELPLSHEIWRLVSSRLTNQLASRWAKILPAMSLAKEAWNFKEPKTGQDFRRAGELFKKLKADGNESAWVQWQMAMAYANLNEGKQAGLYFQSLLNSPQTIIEKDRIFLASARVFFQSGQFETALKYYNMISKDSDYWLESVEEKAWVAVRLKEYDKALAQAKTLTSPVFASQVGPETYYVFGLADIKICDYYGAFKVLKTFKEQFKPRLLELQSLSTKGNTVAALKAEDILESGKTPLSLGGDLSKMPRLFYRDDVIGRSTKLAQVLKQEAATFNQWNNPVINALKTLANQRYQEERQKSLGRMRALAREDLSELSDITKKLRIVEVEAIQHMFPNGKLSVLSKAARAKSSQVVAKASNEFVFPDDGEVWLDELDHYHVNSKGCSGTATN